MNVAMYTHSFSCFCGFPVGEKIRGTTSYVITIADFEYGWC